MRKINVYVYCFLYLIQIFDVRRYWNFPGKAQSEYEYRGEVYHHFRKNAFGQYPMIFRTYPAWESEKDVLYQPILFMPESKRNLILDFENGRGEAFSHFRKEDFSQYPIDLLTPFKSDANGTITQKWSEMNTYGTVLSGINPYLTIKNTNFGAIGPRTQNYDHSENLPTFGTNPEFKAKGGPRWPKLRIKNLDLGVTAEKLSELFSHFGPLKGTYIIKDKNGKSLGTANVYFEQKSHAMKAMNKCNGVALDKKPMKIHIPVPEYQPNNSKKYGISVPNQEIETPDNFEDNGKPSSDFPTLEVPPVNIYEPGFNVLAQSHEKRIIDPMCRQLKTG